MSASVLPSLAGPAGQVKSAMSSPSFIRPPQGVGAFPSIMRLLGWHLHRPNRQLEPARGRNHHLIASAIPACVHVYYDAAPRHKARSVGMAVRRADRSMGAHRAPRPRLWRGEPVTDPQLDLHAASLGPLGIEPPLVIVGGASPRLLETAVRYADGWNVVVEDAQEYRERAKKITDLCEQLGRTRPLLRHVQIFADSLEPAAARDFADRIASYGATTVVFVLNQNHDLATIDRLAKAVLG